MDNQLITNSQYSFRTGLSTFHAISDLHNKIFSGLDEKLNDCCIFVDLAKAFDTADHKILLQKLNCYGFQLIQSFLPSTEATLNGFESFLLVTSARFKQEKCL